MMSFSSKRGISLIAVLMFMLAATTASIVVFRWISSENFASGARLKQTEAYQAAESGIEATQAWLSSKGADVGALVGAFFKEENNKRPINLTDTDKNILGFISSDEKWQSFQVYLVGVDASKAVHKFKFLSVGHGRDGSTVKLAAVFEVDGLYKVEVPVGATGKREPSGKKTKITPYFGGSINLMGSKRLSAATILGDLTGNPAAIDNDLVVTGKVKMSGSGIDIGENLCVGGEFDPNNNNVKVKGNTYIGSSNNFLGFYGDSTKRPDPDSIKGNVYCEGNLKMQNTGTGVRIYGSLTINDGELSFSQGKYPVMGDMVIGNNAYINPSGLGSGNEFSVCGSVWSYNEGGVSLPSQYCIQQVWGLECGDYLANNAAATLMPAPEETARTYGARVIFNRNNNCSTLSPHVLAFKKAVAAGGSLYKTVPGSKPGPGFFTSTLANNTAVNYTDSFPPQNAGAIEAKRYCDDIWRPVSDGCDGSKFMVDDPIASALGKIEAHLSSASSISNEASSGVKCLNNAIKQIGSNGIVTGTSGILPNVLNDCYTQVKNSPNSANLLYGGKNGYLVVKLQQTQDYNLPTALDGKFIFIYDTQTENVFIAPATRNSSIMIFFKKGVTKEVLGKEGCVNDPSNNIPCPTNDTTGFHQPGNIPKKADDGCYIYPYFIYSLDNIRELNNWNDKCPLKGNLYFPAGSCKKVINANNNFRLEENSDLVDSLMAAGILCKRKRGNTGDCDDDEIANSKDDTSEDGSEDGSCSGSIDCVQENVEFELEEYWLAASSRLKVSLASKSISREPIPTTSTNVAPLDESVLVMPRIVRLTKDAFSAEWLPQDDKLRPYYTFMYLNYSYNVNPPIDKPEPVRTCTKVGVGGTLDTKTSEHIPEGFYECTFANDKYSDFYVSVEGTNGGATLELDPRGEQEVTSTTENNCRSVILKASNVAGNFNATVGTDNDKNEWMIKDPVLSSVCESVSGNKTSGYNFTNCSIQNGEVATFEVCALSNPATPSGSKLSLSITGATSPGGSAPTLVTAPSIVKMKEERITITRTSISGIVSCPPQLKGNNWISVDCTHLVTEIPLDKWTCSKGGSLDPQYTIILPDACDIPTGSGLSSVPNARITANIDASNNMAFPADLQWKQVQVTVTGGNLWFTPTTYTSLNIPSSGNYVTTFQAYHSATYEISSSTTEKVTCTGPLACNPVSPFYITNTIKGSITPTGNGTLALSGIGDPEPICTLPASIKSPFKFGDFATIELSSSYCPNGASATTYILGSGRYSPNQSVILSEGDKGEVTVEVTCEGKTGIGSCGNLVVRGEGGCGYDPSWCGGIPIGDVVKTSQNNATNTGSNPPKCIFATNISKLGNATGDILVNGAKRGTADGGRCGGDPSYQQPCATALSGVTRVDGGYYIYASGWYGEFTTTGGEPNCEGGSSENEYAECVLGNNIDPCYVIGGTGAPNNSSTKGVPRPTVTCKNGTMTNPIFEVLLPNGSVGGTTANWTNNTNINFGSEGIRTPILTSITCGSTIMTLEPPITCGTFVVMPVGGSCSSDPTPSGTLTCNWSHGSPRYVYNNNLEGAEIPTPTVKCDNATITSGISFNSTPWPRAVTSATTYTIRATANCGGSSKEANCGTLEVKYAPRISSCNLNTNATSKPTISLNDQSNVCSSGNTPNSSWTNEKWYFTNNGNSVNETEFNWGSMPAATYSGFKVQGNCGAYGQVPKENCSSVSVTVSSGSTTPTATCNVNNLKSCYTPGEGIPRPNISCSSGNPGAASFKLSQGGGSTTANDRTEWNNSGGTYTPSASSVADGRQITLTSVQCGSTTVTPNPTLCGSIDIKTSCTTTNPSSSSSAPSSSSNNTSGPTLGSTTPVGSVPGASVPVNKGQCVSITLNWNNENHLPNVTFSCSNSNAQTDFTTTGANTCTGQYGINNCVLGKVSLGSNNNWNICVNFTGADPVSCQLGSQ